MSFVEGLESLCGGETFWSDNLTLNTNNPDLTRCFQHTALVWIPSLILIVCSPLLFYEFRTSKALPLPWTWLLGTKLALMVVLVLDWFVQLIFTIVQSTSASIPPSEFLYAIVMLVAMSLFLLLSLLCKRSGVFTSGVLYLSWMAFSLCGLVEFRSLIITSTFNSEPVHFGIFVISYILTLAEFILASWADKRSAYSPIGQENGCPLDESSFLSQMTWWWFNTMAILGWKRPLEKEDLWPLSEVNTSKYLMPRFEQYWETAVAKYRKEKAEAARQYHIDLSVKAEKISLVTGKLGKGAKEPSTPSLVWALFMAYRHLIIPAFLFRFACDLISFVNPQVLKILLAFMQDSKAPEWQGYVFAALFLISAEIFSLLNNQFFYIAFRCAFNMQSVLIGTIFKKALRLSPFARRQSTIGEIVNLQAVDTSRLTFALLQGMIISSSIIVIVLSTVFIWQILGPSVMAGVGVMVLLIPLNIFLSTLQKKLQTKQMTFKDQRVKVMNEVLNGIRILKLYAWEPPFEEQIQKIRAEELKVLKTASYINAANTLATNIAPFVITAVSFATFVLSDSANILTPQIAFVSLTLFNMLRFPMVMLPAVITSLIQASVSNARLKKFLLGEEINPLAIQHDPSVKDPIQLEKANFSWEPDAKLPTLQDISLSVPKGSLLAVVGSVGCGKTSLLSAILGEMERKSGRINVVGSVAYVPQQDNILFGKHLDEVKYQKAIDTCALRQDLDILPGGDYTEIGEKGINLSGGQKQRVSLARAVYQDTDVYLLDDPLSAVDSHVGKHIFDQVIGQNGALKHKTRVLVTHGLGFLKYCDQIAVLKGGRVSEVGTYVELLRKQESFAEFIQTYLESGIDKDTLKEEDEDVVEEMLSDLQAVDPAAHRRLKSQLSVLSSGRSSTNSIPEAFSSREIPLAVSGDSSTGPLLRRQKSFRRQMTERKTSSVVAPPPPTSKPAKSAGQFGTKLIETEKVETKSVKLAVFLNYAKAIGYWACLFVLIFYAGSNAFNVGSSNWLADWSDQASLNTTDTGGRLTIYALLGVGQGVLIYVGTLLMTYSMVLASNSLHNRMVSALLRSPSAFFDTTPLGRILNRCGKDTDVLDNTLPDTVQSWLNAFLNVIASIIVVMISTPIFGVVIIPMGIVYYFVQRFYVATSRQLKRHESAGRSPIYSCFQETVTGASVIRAYGCQERFISLSDAKVDSYQAASYPTIMAGRWLTIRLEFIGNTLVFFAALFAVLARGGTSAGIVGLSITYALNITRNLSFAVRFTSDLETNIVSVERIQEYTDNEPEADWVSDNKAPPNWPDKGEIDLIDYDVRYRAGLDLVLKGVNCHIGSEQKIGIVGRTGAGKSSFAMCMFRIIEAAGGKIVIDGVDISTLGLHEVRSRLTIIPQDPVLFSGNIRINLDPIGSHNDSDIWMALENAHLKEFVASLPDQLDHQVSEGGENLSVGQRQLACLARALLRKTKVLILDEATAAVDVETDELIQRTIRDKFRDCTVLTIAHRLNTVMDYDRILVLDKGQIAEFDSPENLLKSPTSVFYSMAKDAGLI